MSLNKLKYILSVIISIIFLKITFSKLSISNVIIKDYFNYENLFYFISFFLIFLPIHFLISYKFVYILKKYTKVKIIDSIKVNLISYIYNLVLPAKAGDLFRTSFLNLKNVNTKNNININLFEKGFSLLCLVLIIFFFFIFSSYNLNFLINSYIIGNKIIIFLIILLGSIFIFFLFYKRNAIKNFLEILSIKIKKIIIIDLIAWLLIFLQIYISLKIIKIELSFSDTILIFGLSIIIGLVPISIGGFGVRDYVIFNLLNNQIDNDKIVLLLIFFNFRYILPIFLGLCLSISYANKKK